MNGLYYLLVYLKIKQCGRKPEGKLYWHLCCKKSIKQPSLFRKDTVDPRHEIVADHFKNLTYMKYSKMKGSNNQTNHPVCVTFCFQNALNFLISLMSPQFYFALGQNVHTVLTLKHPTLIIFSDK